MDLYIETLDLLQCLLETASAKGPTVIVGDMKTTLPQMETLSPYWYKKSPFSYRSALLHDFLLANDLIVANYCYHQHIKMYVNDLSNILCSAMHECASKCMAKKPPDKGKHKKWW